MHIALVIFHLVVLTVAPIFLIGLINRVKAIWAGRRGPALYQTWFDLVRLLRKTPVYSSDSSWIFPIAPYVVLATTICAGLIVPSVPGFAIIAFPGDVIVFAYLLAFGRIALMLSALDTASAFEGMGASREATNSALLEPILLLIVGTLGCLNHAMSFQDIVSGGSGAFFFDLCIRAAIAFALFVILLIESSRVPADDPTTHLELTMVHEVMVLDHSGPELAAAQYAAAMKTTIFALAIAAIANPFRAGEGGLAILSGLTTLIWLGALATGVGLIESLTARLRFRALPLFMRAAFVAVLIALVAVVARQGGLQ